MSNTEQKRVGRRNFRDWPKWQKNLTWVIFAGAIFGSIVISIWSVFDNDYTYENWESTIATVVSVQPRTHYAGPGRDIQLHDRLAVEFYVNGEIFSNNSLTASPGRTSRGDEIEIRFDPNNPNRITRNSPPVSIIDVMIFPAIVVGFILFLVAIETLSARRARKREQGA